jgi:outer membrane murein-binding lipoprotein Lpp
MPLRAILIASALLLAACSRAPDAGVAQQITELHAQVDALQKAQAQAAQVQAPKAELGQQMLNLQIRHARLWAAGENQNWLLAQFQLAELNEALDDVVAENGDAAALQPQRLADVLPMMMKPAVSRLRDAIDNHDTQAFESAYDGLSAACSGCHRIADHGFLVIQRPKTPVLDNLKAVP